MGRVLRKGQQQRPPKRQTGAKSFASAVDPDPALFRSLGWASDGKATINQIEDHFRVGPADHFYGFGERYDYFDQRGRDVQTYIYNEYGDQAATDRTYYASPFFLCSAGYGVYVASTAASVTATTGGVSNSTMSASARRRAIIASIRRDPRISAGRGCSVPLDSRLKPGTPVS